VGIVVRGGLGEGAFQIATQLIILSDQGEVALHVFWHGWSSKALRDASAVGWVSDLLADCWQVILALGILDRG
jgi:hypothetical protein